MSNIDFNLFIFSEETPSSSSDRSDVGFSQPGPSDIGSCSPRAGFNDEASQNQRGSVYSSSSYATSRGFRPTSGADYTLPHPVAPPRSRGMVVKPPARGIKKSSSEVMSAQGSAPSRGILKSSSGVLKPQDVEVSLSNSSSGIIATYAPRVNFSSTVVTSDDLPPPAASVPTPSRLVAETHFTGMFVTPVTSCVPSAVVTSLSSLGTVEAGILEATESASSSAVAPVVNTSGPPSPSAFLHASAAPVLSSGVTPFLPTSASHASTPPIAPPRRRRKATSGEYCLPAADISLLGKKGLNFLTHTALFLITYTFS
ncbi:microtubule-actin cross-linking factor 1, isoforms 6/7-like [Eriocheir sinensis]|uniref:microtubule-actin cross-linking factor 1, isoforms 6/7-like n=1 Tax=Eriocheir sinensis TaxID=95602 RepID=UPI0021C56D0A|nr:microtubule-actin cross-linking factor 1, isoforms 6/7-like [Eriocheir sinensis]